MKSFVNVFSRNVAVTARARRHLFLALLAACALARATDAGLPPIDVQVQVEGGHVRVQARVPLPVAREQAWAVMTDYAHMASFLPNVQEARVLSTDGDRLVTFQRGTAHFGIFSYDFEITRAVTLQPQEAVHSRMISGNMKQLDAQATLRDTAQGLMLDYRSDSVPGYWLPAFVIKPFAEHETREQFEAMRREMLRRYPQ
ncbi:MAG: SRPBCC family protein [Betaproteobacteria bacterium]|nr:SRPBCC family protein [Betaproteobacteria bacterium]